MKLVARHADGKKSEWQMDTDDIVLAQETIFNVIMAETGALPKVVLALIQGGKNGS